VTITYGWRTGTAPGANAPTTPGLQTWLTEQKSTPSGEPTAIASSPQIRIVAKDGSGTLKSSLSTVKHNSTGKTIVFTYTAATGGIVDGAFDLKVPKGWSAPSVNPSAAGYVTATAGSISVAGSFIYIEGLTLPAGSTLTITYGSRAGGGPGAKATYLVRTQTWKAREESTEFPFSRLKALAASPKIKVT
jgi:hypothetical protein